MFVTMRPSQLRPASHVCISRSPVSATNAGLFTSSPKLSPFRSEPLDQQPSIVLTPVFSHSCGLFCAPRKVKSFAICNIHTLSPKHPGRGYPKPQIRSSHGMMDLGMYRLCDVSVCAAGDTSFSFQHRASGAGERLEEFCLLVPYWVKHLRAQSAGTSQKSSGAQTGPRSAVVFHAAARAFVGLSCPSVVN